MGYRAHTITQHREYGDQTFADWEMFTSNFVPAMREQGVFMTSNDAEDYFEVYIEELQEFVHRLPTDDEPSLYPDMTNSELKQALQTAINESPENYIAWEWF